MNTCKILYSGVQSLRKIYLRWSNKTGTWLGLLRPSGAQAWTPSYPDLISSQSSLRVTSLSEMTMMMWTWWCDTWSRLPPEAGGPGQWGDQAGDHGGRGPGGHQGGGQAQGGRERRHQARHHRHQRGVACHQLDHGENVSTSTIFNYLYR